MKKQLLSINVDGKIIQGKAYNDNHLASMLQVYLKEHHSIKEEDSNLIINGSMPLMVNNIPVLSAFNIYNK